MTDLEKQLDELATNKVVPDELEKMFDEISVSLLRHTKLVAGRSEYLIKEIEFYFSGENYNHYDSYAHSIQYKTAQRQGEFGEWYFHRYKSPDTYTRLKYRGLDLTFGKSEYRNYGGILIRRLQNIESYEMIVGIGKIVGEVIENIGLDNLDHIATQTGKLAFDTTSLLHLEVYNNSLDKPIHKSARILPLPKTKERTEYFSKFYRYFNDPEVKLIRP